MTLINVIEVVEEHKRVEAATTALVATIQVALVDAVAHSCGQRAARELVSAYTRLVTVAGYRAGIVEAMDDYVEPLCYPLPRLLGEAEVNRTGDADGTPAWYRGFSAGIHAAMEVVERETGLKLFPRKEDNDEQD